LHSFGSQTAESLVKEDKAVMGYLARINECGYA